MGIDLGLMHVGQSLWLILMVTDQGEIFVGQCFLLKIMGINQGVMHVDKGCGR